MQKVMLFFIFINYFIVGGYSQEMKYPFIYIPGMFDNGDLLNQDTLLVKNLNHSDGYYFENYFNQTYPYDQSLLQCGSNIVDSKYERLIVANVIGPYRTNISLWLMADRLYCLLQGKAPRGKNYNILTNYRGNDYQGAVIQDGKTIVYKGAVEEVWAKYGRKVVIKPQQGQYRVVLNPTEKEVNQGFGYRNQNGYFDNPDEIRFNLVVHSSGGIAIRRYIQMCNDEGISHHINSIINLSVPQQGARLMYSLHSAFPQLIKYSIDGFFNHLDQGSINFNAEGKNISFTYRELADKTRAKMISGDKISAQFVRKIIGCYILYFIPFDGHKRVLGNDPALFDLDPRHRLIRMLSKTAIPPEISIVNYRVKEPYALMFKNISSFLLLEQNDGVVDYRDTDLRSLPEGESLKITDIFVERANHIPLPYIEPLFELHETVNNNYPFLRILLKKKMPREEGVTFIHGLMKAIMKEMGLELEYYLKNEDYSVIDYFAENPCALE